MALSRRRLLQLGLGLGGAMACGGVGYFGTQLVGGRRSRLTRADRSTYVFGTMATVSALHADRAIAQAAADAAIAELRTVQQVMSLYLPDSELSRLNRDGGIDHAHPYLQAAVAQAQAVAEWSNGAFDVTVQPIWDVYAGAKQRGELPSDAELAAVCGRVDWHAVKVEGSRIEFGRPGMAITLNGIAQGFAADRVAIVLREHGIAHALINTGEVNAMGDRPNGDGWRVGIQHPRRPQAYLGAVALRDRCLATSGDYATPFTDDLRLHHIVQPRTGKSPDEVASVTVAAGQATWADALSTAAFVLGPTEGMRLVESIDGADALFVLKDGRRIATEGLSQYVG